VFSTLPQYVAGSALIRHSGRVGVVPAGLRQSREIDALDGLGSTTHVAMNAVWGEMSDRVGHLSALTGTVPRQPEPVKDFVCISGPLNGVVLLNAENQISGATSSYPLRPSASKRDVLQHFVNLVRNPQLRATLQRGFW
jgi:hypothetical protein